MERQVGEILRSTRIEQGISLDAIEKETRIRRRYLEALENEEWDVLPGRVYLKGFMKTYCRFLGIDEEPLLKALEETITPAPEEAKPLPEKIELPGRPRRKLGIVLGVLAILFLLLSQFLYQNYFNKPLSATNDVNTVQPSNSNNGGQSNPDNQEPASAATGGMNADGNQTDGNSAEEPPAKLENFTLSLKVFDYKCWVQVKDGNSLLYEGTLVKGQEKVFEGLTRVSFTLGNPGVVQVLLDDRDLGKFEDNKVVFKKFVLENGEIKEEE